MPTTIKPNLNCNLNGCHLAALKKHITTCLTRWRKRSPKGQEENKDYHHHQIPTEEGCYCHLQQNSSGRSGKLSFVQRTTVYWESFNTKFQKIITPQQRVNRNNPTAFNVREGPRKYGRRVEIVAKLLSSTLIARNKTSAPIVEDSVFEKQIKDINCSAINSTVNFYQDKMTITGLTFMDVREGYPDIDSEVRSILMARAQEGATISEIRDDYRKLTGLTFPIYENVTDFLLTIPHVTAYCSEKGTRIFNIKPINKTKHIHDMVMNQKQRPEPEQKPMSNNYYYRDRERVRHKINRRSSQSNTNFNSGAINVREAIQQEELMPYADTNLSRDNRHVFHENNCFYQDNCNYLFNRVYNQQMVPSDELMEKTVQMARKSIPIPPKATVGNNINLDVSSYKNNINHFNNLFQLQQHQKYQYQQNLNNLRIISAQRPSTNHIKTPMPMSSRSSSPTVKSCYTNDSAYTDSDYEAHLLDFLLLGDDFFLYMARMELRCKFKKNERVLQSGLCVSGQTIGASIKRIKSLSDQRRSVILNIGSVDIMQGRQLIQIEHEFRELLMTMLKKGIKPILTTLAPLANYSHNNQIKRRLERFNEFIKIEAQQKKLMVIDLWKCLVNDKGFVLFDCYQNEPRIVTGTSEPYLFWNKIGRQRVLQLIESKLEY